MNRQPEPYILWLPSWYPSRANVFAGDFIKRHAEAASLLFRIHVIFATAIDMENTIEEDRSSIKGLSEQIIYFKKRKGQLKRIEQQIVWSRLLIAAVKNYIKENGLPKCIHVHVPWNAGLIAIYFKKRYKIPFLVTEHWGIYNRILEDNFYELDFYKRRAIKTIFKKAEILLPVSRYLAGQISQIVPIKKVRVIHNVVDNSQFFYKKERLPKFTFIHVSNMVPLKNVKYILEAFCLLVTQKKITNLQLILVGNKDDEYVNVAREMGLLGTYIHFKGEVSYREVAQEVRKAHCFVLNSSIENSPCVISEALCCGLPVIATNVGGIPELIERENGILITTNDIEALANAMQKMIDSYSLYDFANIAEKASERFGYPTVAKQFAEVYNEIR